MLFDYDMLMNMANINTNTNFDLVDEKEGLQKGNMFKNEYIPYKNYNPTKTIAKNEKEELLQKLYETNFALIDLNLYLDLNPNNENIYVIYRKYVNNFLNYKKMYEQKYGPLEITCVESNTYDWINNPWPWDNDGGNENV